MNNKKAVLITTEHRGVFFGYVIDDSKVPEFIKLADARMCVYWALSTKGVVGLASVGPQEGCKITDKIPSITAWKVTSVMEVTPEAIAAWESAPWKS